MLTQPIYSPDAWTFRLAEELVGCANALIERVDIYGDFEGLYAEYDKVRCIFSLDDGYMEVTWHATPNHLLTNKQWREICCYINEFTPDGCEENHEHYYPV